MPTTPLQREAMKTYYSKYRNDILHQRHNKKFNDKVTRWLNEWNYTFDRSNRSKYASL